MIKANNELGFAFADLYPNMGGIDTSTLATPETDDLDALNEDTEVVKEASVKEARGKNIFLAIMVMIGLMIFLGGK